MQLKRVRFVYSLKWALRPVAGEATTEPFATRLGVSIGCEEVVPILLLRSVNRAYPGLDSSIGGSVTCSVQRTVAIRSKLTGRVSQAMFLVPD
jgi:hypothetical protein